MSRFGGLPSSFRIYLPTDGTGLTGRECPKDDCLGYFKIQFGTGLKGEGLPCHCPYCGHEAPHDQFFTQEQIEYVRSVGVRRVSQALTRELKKLEFNHPPRGAFGIGFSMKVKEGPKPPIRNYRERQLETEVVCDHCTLRYAIYGVFAFCPDCGIHNSPQILSKNLDLAAKELGLADQVEAPDLREHLIADALENVVSAFDGFGREACRVHAQQANDPKQAANMSFQNLNGANNRLRQLFGFDLAPFVAPAEWDLAIRCFNKRHLLAHSMGVVDDKYIKATGDPSAVVGRKIDIRPNEAQDLIDVVRVLGAEMAKTMSGKS